MTARNKGRRIDRAAWARSMPFELFRTYATPHFAVTARLDVSRLLTVLRPQGVSAYRACLFALGSAVNAVPELRTRFSGDTVIEYEAVDLSMTVPKDDESFAYGYLAFDADWKRFDAACETAIAEAVAGRTAANTGERLDLAYLSCMPWLDFSAMTNAMPGPHDCIPRIAWGRFTPGAGSTHTVAAAIEVHHAVADGIHVARFFEAAQRILDTLEPA